MKLILASASPRRRELLTLAGYEYEVCPADIDEGETALFLPSDTVRRLAERKALSVLEKNPDAVILGADTVVAFGNRILGKPSDDAQAYEMLQLLSGKKHTVYTGVAIVCRQKRESFVSAAEVEFFSLTDSEILSYIQSGEPMDKAGAYGIQGKGSLLVREIRGDYYAVVGLPIAQCARRLRDFSVYGEIL